MLKTAYYRLRKLGEAVLYQLRQHTYAQIDKVRDFLIALNEETRPDSRGRPPRRRDSTRQKQAASETPPARRTCPPTLPDGLRVYAIGDIHGRADLLERLIAKIETDADTAPEDRQMLIFLGDYVDRGFQSKDVIDFLTNGKLSRFETLFLKGNHEAAFEKFLNDPGFGPEWSHYGGSETLMSYGIQPPRMKRMSPEWEDVCRQLNEKLPASHRDFLASLDLYGIVGDYVFVHAGLRPDKPIDEQTEQDMLWIREDFLSDPRLFEHVVVHGHTPIEKPHIDVRRIGVDTGAYLTGKLTAVRLVGQSADFLST